MSKKHSGSILPRYRGEEWTGTCLPRNSQHWLTGKQRSISKDSYHSAAYHKELGRVIGKEPWKWPKRHMYFISDMHGAAVTIIHPKGQILGISTDYPYIKVFDPALCAV